MSNSPRRGFRLFMLAVLLTSYSLSGCQRDLTNNNTVPARTEAVTLAPALHYYFVAPNGNDANAGTEAAPFLTVQRGQTAAVPGDIVYIRGGSYTMSTSQIAENGTLYASVTKLNKSGTASARIQYLAYPGETPVFNYANVKPAGKRITAFLVTGSYITIKGIEVIGVQVTITGHTQSECFRNEGSNNIYEALKMHDGMGIGFYLTRGGNNLVLNCDAYRNWDNVSESGKGENTDGFGAHPYKQGVGYTGNVFRGCRAWFNSDDGFDLINAYEVVTIENCWAFYNGYSTSFASLANGNGIKAGGFGVTDASAVPPVVPRHIVRFCLAVGNKSAGFYANHHPGGLTFENNTAYKNAVNYNMLNRSADFSADVPGWGHYLYNNLGYAATSSEVSNLNTGASSTSNNYFQISGITVNASDFTATTESMMSQGRHSDFTLPTNTFLRLVTGSDLIDKGVNRGYTYTGASPDLGCFEVGINKSPIVSWPVAP